MLEPFCLKAGASFSIAVQHLSDKTHPPMCYHLMYAKPYRKKDDLP